MNMESSVFFAAGVFVFFFLFDVCSARQWFLTLDFKKGMMGVLVSLGIP